jgi:hypothetical protein
MRTNTSRIITSFSDLPHDAGTPTYPTNEAIGDSMATLFARAAGVEPELERGPELVRPLMFGPLTPMSFRMSGRDSLADASERFAAEVMAFGCVPSNQLMPMQIAAD